MSEEKLETMRHSASHLLAAAILKLYPDVKFAIGPSIDDGFYYDFEFSTPVTEEDLKKIEKEMIAIKNQKPEIKKLESLSISEAKKLMKDQPYKIELIDDLEKNGETEVSFYQLGDFVDLCRGPHLDNAEKIGAFKLLSTSGAYWRGSEKNKMLTRIYGTAFNTKEELNSYLQLLEEAKKRDHNKLGKDLGLFITSPLVGQGLPLLTPKGTKLKQILQRWIEDEEEKRGYQLTMTPFMAKSDLYKVSGHWDHYRDGMFLIDGSGEEMALRPMTCPYQFQLYKAQTRSYRELPIRYNETSTLFRNEASGEMHGLIRLRQFTLAEGHIICRMDQLEEEFDAVLDLIAYVMKRLELTDFTYRFSKWDPENKKGKYIDNPKAWEESQATLKKILDKHKFEYVEAEGEAAFYGPKLDIQTKNVFGKEDTLITVQIDFALPERFDMNYTDAEGKDVRPIVIHRSSIGCYERTMAMLIEKFAGEFPLWLSPVQLKVLSINDELTKYATEVAQKLKAEGFRVEVDGKSESLGKKIRNAEVEKIPYMLIAGEKEKEAGSVSVRSKKDGDLGMMSVEDLVKKLKEEIGS